jgi:hypothetical protein
MAVKVTIDIPEQAISIILSTPERFVKEIGLYYAEI